MADGSYGTVKIISGIQTPNKDTYNLQKTAIPISIPPNFVLHKADNTSISYIASKVNEVNISNDKYIFENEIEVISYINKNENITNLLKALPNMVEHVFGDAELYLSVFHDYEENWSNLIIDIKTNQSILNFLEKESQLFGILENKPDFLIALKHVTIACV